jgi:uncharacterized protein YaiE (UPF0345 family)
MSQSAPPAQISNVSVPLKANVYFNGKVVSHTLLLADGGKKTVGLIYPGAYHFDTRAAEKMEIIAGACQVKQKNEKEWKSYAAGSFFDVPADSGFDIKVDGGIAEYLCHFV